MDAKPSTNIMESDGFKLAYWLEEGNSLETVMGKASLKKKIENSNISDHLHPGFASGDWTLSLLGVQTKKVSVLSMCKPRKIKKHCLRSDTDKGKTTWYRYFLLKFYLFASFLHSFCVIADI